MNLLFLDFDGVLNSKYTKFELNDDPLDQTLVRRVSAFVEHVDARIVISSAWRHHFSLKDLQDKLHRKGLRHPERVIDVTPDHSGIIHALKWRGKEIHRWLEAHRSHGPYVILDDMPASYFKPVAHRLIQTDERVGVSKADIRRAEWLLKQPVKKVA